MEQNALSSELTYDPEIHNVYIFLVIPEYNPRMKGSKRTRRTRSYAKVDRIFVQARSPTPDIEILGMYPNTRMESGVYRGLLSFVPIAGKLRAIGKVKDAIKRGKHSIIAHHTGELAQWVFLKPYLEQHTEFPMKILCLVSEDVTDEYRFLRCDVSAQDKGREVLGIYGRIITLPKS